MPTSWSVTWTRTTCNIEDSAGALNFNDGLLVVLQRNAIIDEVASFDEGFDRVGGFRRVV